MGFFLIVISFIFLLVIYSKFNFESFEVLLYSFLSQLLLILIVTESLSALSLLDKSFIPLSWLLIDTILLSVCLTLYKGFKFNIRFKKPELSVINGIIALVFILLIIQAIAYPPNNYDAMTYHMARIPHWLSNHSLEHYPTNIYRQLYQPPLSSIILMHINVLSGGDYLSNTLQIGFLFVALKTIEQIGILLGVKKVAFMLLLLITIPSVILQASSVTNNIIESTFVLIAVLYALRITAHFKGKYLIVIGLAAGFCLLTKGTAYIFIAPVYLITAINLLLRQKGILQSVSWLFLSGILALLINSGHYYRNYQLCGNLLGTDPIEAKKYAPEHNSVKNIGSNIIKNIGIHFGPRPINQIAEKGIYKIHQMLGMDINGKGQNFNDFDYKITASPNTEDNAPNFIHMCLILSCTVLILFTFRKARGEDASKKYMLFEIILLQFILFNILLKWQPWHARNQIAMFFEFVPLIAVLIIDKMPMRWIKLLFTMLVVYAFTLILFNRLRPLIRLTPLTTNLSILSPRQQKFYADRTEVSKEFEVIDAMIPNKNYLTIGMSVFWNEYEYPFFSSCYSNTIKPYHILIDDNPSKKILRKELSPDIIISTRTYLKDIYYNKVNYINVTTGHTYIALFRRAN